jgi:predicted amidophosphoribosyltransferase
VTIEEASPVLLHSPILLAPIAATVDSIRLRDADPVADLADTAAALLRRSGMKIRSQRLLSMRQGHRDHVGLSRGERIANMHDAFTLRGRAPCGAPVVLVDDVVTTGATLASAQRILVGAGFDVLGAGVIAAAKGGLT